MPHNESECARARSRRDLANPQHASSSLRASIDRRLAAVRRRRASRAGRSAVAVTVAVLVAGSAGAVAHQRGGEPAPRKASASAKGKAGYSVEALQRELGVTADGVLGPATRRAVRRFQRRSGLTVDGVVGPATLAALGIDGLTPRPAVRRSRSSRSSRASRTTPSARLQAIARCESGGDPTAVSPSGRYRGKYQFSRATWRAVGGSGDPAAAPEAEQDRRAAILLRRQGAGAWPNCA